MTTGEQLVLTLNQLGFYQFLLPWLFAFAITYGILYASGDKLFGKMNARISAVIALVVAFFVTAYAGPAMAAFFITLFGNATLVLAGILVIVLLIGMIGYKVDKLQKNGVVVALVVIGIILFFISTGAASGIGYWAILSPDMIALVLVLIVIVAAVYMITKPEEKGDGGGEKK